jgi:hypothetical protein
MKNFLSDDAAGMGNAGTSLSLIVKQVCLSLMADANCSQTTLTTEISPELQLPQSVKEIEPVICSLLESLVSCAKNGRIHISAERFRDLIVLQFEEHNNYNGYALEYSVQALQPLARRVGADLTMKDQQKLHTTISLSFLNN